MTGTVSKTTLDERFRPGTFLIRADGDDVRYEQIVDPDLTIFAPFADSFILPEWFPPFTLRECVNFHTVIMSFIDNCLESNGWSWSRTRYYEVIRYSWLKRLPLEPAEVWQLLMLHGVPPACEEEARRLFLEGVELLVYAKGRRPIKKKRLNEKRRKGT